MGNGKLQQFNYSRSLITNRGMVERGIRRMAYYLVVVQEQPLCEPTTMTIAMTKWEFYSLENKAELQLVEIAILIGQFQSDRAF